MPMLQYGRYWTKRLRYVTAPQRYEENIGRVLASDAGKRLPHPFSPIAPLP